MFLLNYLTVVGRKKKKERKSKKQTKPISFEYYVCNRDTFTILTVILNYSTFKLIFCFRISVLTTEDSGLENRVNQKHSFRSND